MPEGAAQRSHNEKRLAELEATGAARRARMATVLAAADLDCLAVQPPLRHVA